MVEIGLAVLLDRRKSRALPALFLSSTIVENNKLNDLDYLRQVAAVVAGFYLASSRRLNTKHSTEANERRLVALCGAVIVDK